jgi:hypothetical protein
MYLGASYAFLMKFSYLSKKKKKKKVKLLTLNVSGAKEGTDVQCVKRARFLCRGFFGVDKWLS